LARCSVFCAPSLRGESFGIVLLEAMAAGAPLVASNISGYNNVASSERNALLVEPGNPVELARCIMRTFKEPELRKSLVTGGYERATDFSMERLAEQYLSIYRKLLSDEKLRILEIKPNRFVAIFGDRILRRPKFLSAKDD
jgi:phosphatidylinositol alpha-mannosyltransferase